MQAHSFLAVCTDVCRSHILLSFTALKLGLSHSNIVQGNYNAQQVLSYLLFQVSFASVHSIHFKDKNSRVKAMLLGYSFLATFKELQFLNRI